MINASFFHSCFPATERLLFHCLSTQILCWMQAAAIDLLLLERRHVVICTATASGKSLCYNVPVLQVCGIYNCKQSPTRCNTRIETLSCGQFLPV